MFPSRLLLLLLLFIPLLADAFTQPPSVRPPLLPRAALRQRKSCGLRCTAAPYTNSGDGERVPPTTVGGDREQKVQRVGGEGGLVDAEQVGLDPSGYVTAWHKEHFGDEVIERLLRDGYVVVDGGFSDDEAWELHHSMAWAMDQFEYEHGDSWRGTRDDVVAFVSEEAAWVPPPISLAIQRLKGIAEVLQRPTNRACATDPKSSWRLRPGAALPPATEERPSTVTELAQLSCFGPGGQYVRHSDNMRGMQGERKNFRLFSALAYCQSGDYTPDNEGWLRLWPGSDEIEPYESDDSLEGMLKAKRKREGVRGGEGEDVFVNIEPRAGRVVLFRSTLLHQVCPSVDMSRRAIALWFFTPQELTPGYEDDFDGAMGG